MISVLRIGHRIQRDKRITTHVGLVARTFGADEIIIDTKDDQIKTNLQSICERFGGSFAIKTGVSPLQYIKQWKGVIVHLTMYGEPFEKIISKIDKTKDLLIIVGAEKVPRQYYELTDFNASVGNQPHSEVSALALFLDRFHHGSWKNKSFHGKMNIYPSKRGKQVITTKKE